MAATALRLEGAVGGELDGETLNAPVVTLGKVLAAANRVKPVQVFFPVLMVMSLVKVATPAVVVGGTTVSVALLHAAGTLPKESVTAPAKVWSVLPYWSCAVITSGSGMATIDP